MQEQKTNTASEHTDHASGAQSMDDVTKNKDMAALSYVWILSVFVYMSKRESPFVRFHARQGIVLFLLSIIVWPIPVVGKMFELVVLAGCVIGFLAAAQGHRKEVPLVGPLARGDYAGMRAHWKSFVDSMSHAFKSDKKHPPSNQPPTPPSH